MIPPWFDRLIGSPGTSAAREARQILVIDDQPEMRDLLAISLRQLGWEVQVASSGEEALTLMKTAHGTVGLALVDVVMPGIDGMSLARRLRASYPGLGIILVSGRLNDESRWIVSEEGFQFLPKPFNLVHLRDAVVGILGEGEPPVKR